MPTDKERLIQIENTIRNSSERLRSEALRIASGLYEIYNKELFKIRGYKNIYDYAQETHGIAKSTTNEFINVIRRFGKRYLDGPDRGNYYLEASGISGLENYDMSKLVLLSRLTSKELARVAPDISPDMPIKEIRLTIKERIPQEKKPSVPSVGAVYAASNGRIQSVPEKPVQKEAPQKPAKTTRVLIENIKEYIDGAPTVEEWLKSGFKVTLVIEC